MDGESSGDAAKITTEALTTTVDHLEPKKEKNLVRREQLFEIHYSYCERMGLC